MCGAMRRTQGKRTRDGIGRKGLEKELDSTCKIFDIIGYSVHAGMPRKLRAPKRVC